MTPSPDVSAALLSQWSRRFAEPVTGWSFSGFADVVTSSDPPWSYPTLAREAVRGATSVLDLGTGGGEFLRTLADALPADTHATEGWPTNLPVARAALAPLGVEVAAHDPAGGPLPFPDSRFDVVLSRHAAYDAADVARVLRPGGTLLTQQVDGRNLDDLARLFGAGPAFPHVTVEAAARAAEDAGLRVHAARSWSGPVTFADGAALLSFLRTVPWHLPADFTVESHADVLLALDEWPRLEFTERRFLLHARR